MNALTEPSHDLAISIAHLIDDLKGQRIRILDVSEACNFTSYFVLATAMSSPQIRAIAGRVQRDLRDRGIRPIGVAGVDTDSWAVLDFGDIVVHVFSLEAREHYNLENLWHDGTVVEWAD